ncbi:MAG: symmetrical bis(5'-nucleosyl)-tetraphosphatase [Deltaproteobacteria bacterium]|nr:symmetrical bis(5'-nucleosyl)-tetraphosphatase [Deltaproteobacteria bacterium]
MAIYAIGDVQGCYDSLRRLVERLFLQDDDRVWFVGDLVNRGPKSAEVLRWIKARDEQCVVVLGNHDLHLLAMAAGLREPKGRDTAQSVLEKDDGGALVDWLRTRPLMHRAGDRVLVHAGLHPSWTTQQALALAEEVETVLASPDWRDGLESLYGNGKDSRWDESLEGAERLRAITAIFTRLRFVRDHDGEWVADSQFVGPPAEAPKSLRPWFEVDRERDEQIVFGHWAALGLHHGVEHLGLDTGCVWGGALTAVRLDDGAVFSQPAVD